METDALLLDEPASRAARVIALALLEEARSAHHRLPAAARAPHDGDDDDATTDDDADALHAFRVAVRRLRSWLRAFRPVLDESVPRKTARRLARIADATGESRDAEVHVAWLRAQRDGLSARERVGLVWLVERTMERKRVADAALAAALARDYARVAHRLARTLEYYTARVHIERGADEPTFASLAATLVAEHAAALRRCLGEVHAPEDQKTAHAARIAAKRLRYLLEPVAPHVEGGDAVVAALKALQDALGDMHDVQLFSAELLAAAGESASEQARRVAAAILEGDDGAAAARAERPHDPRPGLQRLAVRLRERGERAFADVERDWLDDHAAPFFGRLDDAVAALRRRGAAGREIERKFLLAALPPEAAALPAVEIEQGYLPGRTLVERLRRERAADGSERCSRTVKVGRGLSRLELEEEAPPELFASLWALTEGRRVRKRRYALPAGADGAAWVVDEFLDRALVLAEVELPSADSDAEAPAWLRAAVVREVTDEHEFTNARLAR